MPNPYFRFKQFTIYQDRCAMKVGTDGVLLGALTQVSAAENALDIGTGTGLVSLMLAQRKPTLQIDAIEIDPEAAAQAAQNVAQSPWPHICVQAVSLQDYAPNKQYSLIVSNPPYFVNSLKAPQAARNTARHTDTLSFSDLLAGVNRLLLPGGCFWVILPSEAQTTFCWLAAQEGLYPQQIVYVHPRADKPAKRVVMCLVKQELTEPIWLDGEPVKTPPPAIQTLIIEKERHVYTPQFALLTAPYYL